MTHGDAIIIIKRRTDSLEKRMEALNLIFDDDFKHDYYCLNKLDLWETAKFLYKEVVNGKS